VLSCLETDKNLPPSPIGFCESNLSTLQTEDALVGIFDPTIAPLTFSLVQFPSPLPKVQVQYTVYRQCVAVSGWVWWGWC
jgi:hypothetical protein